MLDRGGRSQEMTGDGGHRPEESGGDGVMVYTLEESGGDG